MYNYFRNIILLSAVFVFIADSCLITNCPRGGKRSGLQENRKSSDIIKQCVACGPELIGRCFGPSICCGPFGCLINTADTIRCKRYGEFNEPTPCIAGKSTCGNGNGRCALNEICCSQDSCFKDSSCKEDNQMDILHVDGLLNLLNPFSSDFTETH